MRKTNKASQASARKPKSASVPLKARSLSELRNLQRQASKHAEPTPEAGRSSETSHRSPADHPASGTRARRRPHRFLPPGAGPVTAARDATPKSASDVVTPSPQRHSLEPATDTQPCPTLSAGAYSTTAGHSPESVLNAEDVALFRRVVQSVTPAPKSNRLLLDPVAPATPAQLQERRQHAMGQAITPALDVSDHYASAGLDRDDTVFLQTGHGPHLVKGLKKGKWPVQASLDLHGSNLDQARDRLDRFIQSCRDHQIRCVRIVHGKGYGSKGGDPVLKETVRRWLSQLAVVLAYVESDESHGGAGAVVVLLSKNKSGEAGSSRLL